MELPRRTEQTINDDVGKRNSTFNIFSREKTSINNPFFIKTDLKDLLRLAQWLFFIVSQSEASNFSTAKKADFFDLLRVRSVNQPSFYFFLTDIYSAKKSTKLNLRQLL